MQLSQDAQELLRQIVRGELLLTTHPWQALPRLMFCAGTRIYGPQISGMAAEELLEQRCIELRQDQLPYEVYDFTAIGEVLVEAIEILEQAA